MRKAFLLRWLKGTKEKEKVASTIWNKMRSKNGSKFTNELICELYTLNGVEKRTICTQLVRVTGYNQFISRLIDGTKLCRLIKDC